MSDHSGRWSPDDVVDIQLDKENSVLVHLYGATILSWKCNGEEVLFLSKKAVFDNKKAIRGGIPLVFPCFGPWSNGPQHGFARIKRWKMESSPIKSGDTCKCVLSLEEDEGTKAMWDYRFRLSYTVELAQTSMKLTLTVNNTDSKPFQFTTLMHTYFGSSDISKTTVQGLKAKTYVDKLKDSKTFTEDRDEVTVNENYDRVYQNCTDDINVKTSPNKEVRIALENMTDVVVWNPWKEKAAAMSDFGDDEYLTMICVEAGSVSQDFTINEGQTRAFSQTISVKANL